MSHRDKHHIYFKYISLFSDHFHSGISFKLRTSYMKKPLPYIFQVFHDFLSDALNWIEIAVHDASRLQVVREFSTFYFLPFAPLLWLKRARFVLNINHNLNRRAEASLIGYLSRYFKFAFIGGGPELRSRFPFIEIIEFRRPTPPRASQLKQVLCFVGSRSEQTHPDLSSIIIELTKLSGDYSIQTKFVGANKSLQYCVETVSYVEDFSRELQDSIVIFAYNPSNYNYRHSGVFWEILDYAPLVLYPKSDVLDATAQYRQDSAIGFNSVEDLVAALSRILIDYNTMSSRSSLIKKS